MKENHRSKLKHVELTLATGDICDANVDAIVSSEQTDFVLSRNPEALSGQIWKRYGASVQRELDAAPRGALIPCALRASAISAAKPPPSMARCLEWH
jgi:hypothetical protein